MVKVAPSILSADFANLGQAVKDVERAGADYIHIDVMDGHFVPNITIGPDVVSALRKVTKLPIDVHLMIESPDSFIESFARAGADIITVHAEAVTHLDRTVNLIKSYGKKVGVSIVPSTVPAVLKYVLADIDLVLVMTVNPGFGGQAFLESQLPKIVKIRNMIDNLGEKNKIELEVDGGINEKTAKKVLKAGANVLVAGSYIFGGKKSDYEAKITKLKC